MMHMWYWFGTNLGDFLFPGYNVTTTWGLIATCLGVCSLAIFYEGMQVVQFKIRQNNVASLPQKLDGSTENTTLLFKFSPISFGRPSSVHCKHWSGRLLEVFHWTIQTTLGYILMLAVMTFNGYISIALVIGGSLGYWMFGQILMELNMKQIKPNVPCDPECSDAIETRESC